MKIKKEGMLTIHVEEIENPNGTSDKIVSCQGEGLSENGSSIGVLAVVDALIFSAVRYLNLASKHSVGTDETKAAIIKMTGAMAAEHVADLKPETIEDAQTVTKNYSVLGALQRFDPDLKVH